MAISGGAKGQWGWVEGGHVPPCPTGSSTHEKDYMITIKLVKFLQDTSHDQPHNPLTLDLRERPQSSSAHLEQRSGVALNLRRPTVSSAALRAVLPVAETTA